MKESDSKKFMIFSAFLIVLAILALLGFDILSYLPFLKYLAEKDYLTLKTLINSLVLIALSVLFMHITSSIIKKYLERRLDKAELKLILSVYRYAFVSLLVIIILVALYKRFSTVILSVS